MPTGTHGPRDKGIKRSTLGASRTKVKITPDARQIWRPGGNVILDHFGSNSFSTDNIFQ